MSQETVEILRTLADQFNRGDFDNSLQFMDASVELHPGVLAPHQEGRFVGHQGLIEFVRGATEPRSR